MSRWGSYFYWLCLLGITLSTVSCAASIFKILGAAEVLVALDCTVRRP